MELISMSDYALQQYSIKQSNYRFWKKIGNYANFLKQPLELWMFVPCDENGNVLEEPKISCATCEKCTCSVDYQLEHEKAKERCLFKDIKYTQAKEESNYSYLGITELGQINYPTFWKGLVIEDLIQYNLTLTQTAINQITK